MADSERVAFFSKLFGGLAYPIRTRLAETALSVQCANLMRVAVVERRYVGVFTHVPNEGKRSARNGWMLKAMGMVPGALDWWFIWTAADGTLRGGVIELKVGTNSLTPAQAMFVTWCDRDGVPRAVARTRAQFEDVLREWGALRG